MQESMFEPRPFGVSYSHVGHIPVRKRKRLATLDTVSSNAEWERIFTSRKRTLMQKAYEFEVCTGSEVTLVIKSPVGERWFYDTSNARRDSLMKEGLIGPKSIRVSGKTLNSRVLLQENEVESSTAATSSSTLPKDSEVSSPRNTSSSRAGDLSSCRKDTNAKSRTKSAVSSQAKRTYSSGKCESRCNQAKKPRAPNFPQNSIRLQPSRIFSPRSTFYHKTQQENSRHIVFDDSDSEKVTTSSRPTSVNSGKSSKPTQDSESSSEPSSSSSNSDSDESTSSSDDSSSDDSSNDEDTTKPENKGCGVAVKPLQTVTTVVTVDGEVSKSNRVTKNKENQNSNTTISQTKSFENGGITIKTEPNEYNFFGGEKMHDSSSSEKPPNKNAGKKNCSSEVRNIERGCSSQAAPVKVPKVKSTEGKSEDMPRTADHTKESMSAFESSKANGVKQSSFSKAVPAKVTTTKSTEEKSKDLRKTADHTKEATSVFEAPKANGAIAKNKEKTDNSPVPPKTLKSSTNSTSGGDKDEKPSAGDCQVPNITCANTRTPLMHSNAEYNSKTIHSKERYNQNSHFTLKNQSCGGRPSRALDCNQSFSQGFGARKNQLVNTVRPFVRAETKHYQNHRSPPTNQENVSNDWGNTGVLPQAMHGGRNQRRKYTNARRSFVHSNVADHEDNRSKTVNHQMSRQNNRPPNNQDNIRDDFGGVCNQRNKQANAQKSFIYSNDADYENHQTNRQACFASRGYSQKRTASNENTHEKSKRSRSSHTEEPECSSELERPSKGTAFHRKRRNSEPGTHSTNRYAGPHHSRIVPQRTPDPCLGNNQHRTSDYADGSLTPRSLMDHRKKNNFFRDRGRTRESLRGNDRVSENLGNTDHPIVCRDDMLDMHPVEQNQSFKTNSCSRQSSGRGFRLRQRPPRYERFGNLQRGGIVGEATERNHPPVNCQRGGIVGKATGRNHPPANCRRGGMVGKATGRNQPPVNCQRGGTVGKATGRSQPPVNCQRGGVVGKATGRNQPLVNCQRGGIVGKATGKSQPPAERKRSPLLPTPDIPPAPVESDKKPQPSRTFGTERRGGPRTWTRGRGKARSRPKGRPRGGSLPPHVCELNRKSDQETTKAVAL